VALWRKGFFQSPSQQNSKSPATSIQPSIARWGLRRPWQNRYFALILACQRQRFFRNNGPSAFDGKLMMRYQTSCRRQPDLVRRHQSALLHLPAMFGKGQLRLGAACRGLKNQGCGRWRSCQRWSLPGSTPHRAEARLALLPLRTRAPASAGELHLSGGIMSRTSSCFWRVPSQRLRPSCSTV